VTDEAQIAVAVDLTVACHGRLKVMYYHAGNSGPKATDSIASLDIMVANVPSMVTGIRHTARVMVPQFSCIF
jgi:hypothetical protein